MRLSNLLKMIVLRLRILRRPSIAYCANHNLLPGVFIRTPSPNLRELLLLPESPHKTQLNQDIFALIANRFQTGYFVEIGANDGFFLSNTVYLEEMFGWNGLLVEANPQYQKSLEKRKSRSIISAIVENEGYYEFNNAGIYGGLTELLDKAHEKKTKDASLITVWGTTLERILKENNAPEIINFISIDVEGAEVPIVEQMCMLQNYRFVCGCIEYNDRQTDCKQITRALHQAGYKVVWAKQTRQDLFFVDSKGLVGIGSK